MIPASVGYFMLGCLIGFFLGYLTKALREIKEELDEVDEIVKQERNRNEAGFMRFPIVADVMLLLVVALTAWAAISSQRASNDVKSTQEALNEITACNRNYLGKTILALNERTTYTAEQNAANVDLQRSQAKFLSTIFEDPENVGAPMSAALSAYVEDLTNFIVISEKSAKKAIENPYPTEEQLASCFRTAE